MIVTCTNCNIEFDKRPILVEKSINHFCKPACYYEWKAKNPPIPHNKKEKIKYNCDTCQKEILIENWAYQKILNGKQKHTYCSKECRSLGESDFNSGDKNKQFNRITKECLYCKQEYQVKFYLKDKSKYCSKECKNNHTKLLNTVKVNCAYCFKEMIKKPFQVKERNFCSVQCANKYRETKVQKVCVVCGKTYNSHAHNSDKRVACSKKCTDIWLSKIYSQNPEIKEKHRKNGINSVINQKKCDTKPELIVKNYLLQNNINFIPQHPMFNMFVVDFYLPDSNIVIEVLGDYWHGHPDKYGDEEGKKKLTEKQIKNKKKDEIKFNYLTKAGYKVYMIWECDIYQDIEKSMSFLIAKT